MCKWKLFGLTLLLNACSSLSQPASGTAAPTTAQEVTLYIQRATAPAGRAASNVTPLVIPGASWLEHDLGPLLAAQPTIFYDMRGRGRSSVVGNSKEMSIARDVADLELVRQQLGAERMRLLGWAYGAQVITRYAMAHPEQVESLVLVGPLPPRQAEFWQSYLRRYAARFSKADGERLAALQASKTKQRNPELYCRSVQEASMRSFVYDEACLAGMQTRPWVLPNLDPERNARHAQAILADLGQWDWTEELAALQVPVLVVHGEHELLPRASSQAYVDALPQARLLVIEGAGHMPWLEQPERFFEPVRAFLSAAARTQNPSAQQQDSSAGNR